jgi:hypothetical protein
MKSRCNNPNHQDYKWYGAKGIRVCEEWSLSFKEFEKWALTNGYADNLTIDRRDNARIYEPENCRWLTQADQNRNKAKRVKKNTSSIFS